MKTLLPFLILLLTGCAVFNPNGSKLDALQTQIHDLGNTVKDTQDENKAHKDFRKCVTIKIEFSADSFGFYKRCPKDAVELKKELVKDSYQLTK